MSDIGWSVRTSEVRIGCSFSGQYLFSSDHEVSGIELFVDHWLQEEVDQKLILQCVEEVWHRFGRKLHQRRH